MKARRDTLLGDRPYATSCQVPKAKYRWVEGLESDRIECVRFHPDQRERHHVPLSALDASRAGSFEPPFLWPRQPSKESERGYRRYDPMAVAGLHRRFAGVRPSADGVLQFASRFGLLGHRTWYARDPVTDVLGDAETLGTWTEEIARMKTLVELFDLSRSRVADDQRRLKAVIETRRREGRFLREAWLEAHPEYVESLPYIWAPHIGESREPTVLARAYLLAHVNARLREWASPVVGVEKETGMAIAPANLLGALYVHLAHEAIGRTRPPIQCPTCMRFFESTHGTTRYCGDSCKQRAYLARKQAKGNDTDGN